MRQEIDCYRVGLGSSVVLRHLARGGVWLWIGLQSMVVRIELFDCVGCSAGSGKLYSLEHLRFLS